MSKTRFLLTKSLWSSRMRYLETEVLQIVLQVAPQVCPQGPPILRDTKKALYLGVGRERDTLETRPERVLSWEVGGP